MIACNNTVMCVIVILICSCFQCILEEQAVTFLQKMANQLQLSYRTYRVRLPSFVYFTKAACCLILYVMYVMYLNTFIFCIEMFYYIFSVFFTRFVLLSGLCKMQDATDQTKPDMPGKFLSMHYFFSFFIC